MLPHVRSNITPEEVERQVWIRGETVTMSLAAHMAEGMFEDAKAESDAETETRIEQEREAAHKAGRDEMAEVAGRLADRHRRALEASLDLLHNIREKLGDSGLRGDMDAAMFAIESVSEELNDFDFSLGDAERAPEEDAKYEREWRKDQAAKLPPLKPRKRR